ncbi:amidase-like [Lytechinus variegatus]|uniref:amidase-like n=1 Tax=Lytechinus variegatus TaxID=7654 RepID=UPI001BB202C3|nr:amidase-like [Lytechinus variegatus]
MVRCPTRVQLSDIARDMGLHLEDDELKHFHAEIEGNIEKINETEDILEPRLPTKYPRLPGYRPGKEENPYNEWYWKCEIKGASDGKLAGKRVAVKDTVAVAGIPMMNGCHALEGFTPDFDATVVTRILDAGGTIVGKATCEDLCFTGCSSTAAKGPVKNPHDPTRSTAGSSSGSAVVVQTGEADMSIGGDQGGSIRLPAAWTGVVGLKPTYGLVPYTGAMGMEMSVDHLGPMSRTVYGCALLLEVIAGYDGGLDARQHPHLTVPEYTKEMENASIEGLKVGLLSEGFSMKGADEAVNKLVKETLNKLTAEGAVVKDVSVPLHTKSSNIWGAIAEGAYEHMCRLGSCGIGHVGYYPTSFAIASGKMFSSRVDDLSNSMKVYMLQGEYLKKYYRGQVYCRGRNLVLTLRQAYDKIFEKVDVLAMPTIPFTASKLIFKDDLLSEYFRKCYETLDNTMAFNLTGHPAISVNAGYLGGLPVGLMIVGQHYDEVTVFKVAQAVEKIRDEAK